MKKDSTPSKKISKPSKITFSGWKKIAFKVKDEIGENNVSILSAGAAFYSFLAVFPAIGALVSIYGLAMDPQSLQTQLSSLSQVMPQQAFGIIETQLEKILSTPGNALSLSLVFGILLSLWSANKGTKSLFTGIDIAYDSPQKRGFIKQNALTLLFTLAAILFLILSMAVIVVFPVMVEFVSLPEPLTQLIEWLRWVILAILLVYFLGSIYKYAPAKRSSPFKWVLPGAILATVMWLIASWGFSFYVKNFGSYGEVYGSISAVVVMLLWLFITSFIILIGAEVNAQAEQYAGIKSLKDEKIDEDLKN